MPPIELVSRKSLEQFVRILKLPAKVIEKAFDALENIHPTGLVPWDELQGMAEYIAKRY